MISAPALTDLVTLDAKNVLFVVAILIGMVATKGNCNEVDASRPQPATAGWGGVTPVAVGRRF